MGLTIFSKSWEKVELVRSNEIPIGNNSSVVEVYPHRLHHQLILVA